ncbi:DegT/DnrJ/EryC1/StrS family aminotransferase [Bacillus sp. FJAT-50079]|uniref:DegT/DnrJ/EryC1/StrS family aminotransferase n=1 Tax=Bacillus sp. FJAT-50079 TaxID=2833577 RepID=UPI001BC91BB2|nr:DegT/DnrJ/EryC1/StrS family aminotransferase [Bacillus sp. FJAT-50079]MBS4208294.1 DegT/DnrJ/EryC1/StrS family aminotransferase [Bacillus sp. FJAT-50079]
MIPIASPVITKLEKELVNEVLESGNLATGEYVTKFEQNFANYIGVPYAIATSSGTTGLHAAIESLSLPEGSEIITTPFTFIASSNSILYSKHQPIFVDIDPETFNMNPDYIRDLVRNNRNIKAILVVHLYGLPANMKAIMDIAKEFNLKVIEDCAQAHGAEINGRKVGTFGDVGVFSFYPTKNMTTSEGGMIVTHNEEINAKSRLLINHGSPERYVHTIIGYNYRMTNISAAIGIGQLKQIEHFTSKRISNANMLNKGLGDIKWLRTPYAPEGFKHVYHQYTIKIEGKGRTEVIKELEKAKIGYGVHYPTPIHLQPVYKELGYGTQELPHSEKLANEVLSLPVHPGLSELDIKKIVSVFTSL